MCLYRGEYALQFVYALHEEKPQTPIVTHCVFLLILTTYIEPCKQSERDLSNLTPKYSAKTHLPMQQTTHKTLNRIVVSLLLKQFLHSLRIMV